MVVKENLYYIKYASSKSAMNMSEPTDNRFLYTAVLLQPNVYSLVLVQLCEAEAGHSGRSGITNKLCKFKIAWKCPLILSY